MSIPMELGITSGSGGGPPGDAIPISANHNAIGMNTGQRSFHFNILALLGMFMFSEPALHS